MREELNLAVGVQPINALKWNFLRLPLGKIESRIGEINRTVGTDNHIIRAVESLALIMVCQHRVMSLRVNRNNPSKHARAVNKMNSRSKVFPSGSPSSIR